MAGRLAPFVKKLPPPTMPPARPADVIGYEIIAGLLPGKATGAAGRKCPFAKNKTTKSTGTL